MGFLCGPRPFITYDGHPSMHMIEKVIVHISSMKIGGPIEPNKLIDLMPQNMEVISLESACFIAQCLDINSFKVNLGKQPFLLAW